MKSNYLNRPTIYTPFCFAIFALSFIFNAKALAEDSKHEVTSDQIIARCQSGDIYTFESAVGDRGTDYDHLGSELQKLFRNSQSNFAKSSAAYFLGEIHYANSVYDLASEIDFKFQGAMEKHLVKIDISKYPAKDALIKIGNPAISALIRNLAESDDFEVRNLSLQTLCRIDGDKDIVRLRLQKALKIETDSKKQARLQSALDALDKTSF